MQLTKTQRQLIDDARAHGGVFSVTRVSGRGAFGGRISHGARQRDALFALERAGLVRIVDRQTDTDYARGNAVHSTSWAYALTTPMPTDDQFLAALGPCGR